MAGMIKRRIRRAAFAVTVLGILFSGLGPGSLEIAAGENPPGDGRARERAASPFVLVDDGRPAADIALIGGGELLRDAAGWIAAFAERSAGAAPRIGGPELLDRPGGHIVAALDGGDPRIEKAAGKLPPLDSRLGPQGYSIVRLWGAPAGDLLVVRSSGEIGCRYGLIEVLRSLEVEGRAVRTSIGRVVDRPAFPVRIAYVNFAEHLQNAYGPNLLFDAPRNRWTDGDWERWIDMLSAFRYNVFEFWLVPTLFSPEALSGGKVQAEFARVMNRVAEYGRRRGVDVHPIVAVNCVGPSWHYHCPRDPKEREEILALWDHWSRALAGIASIGIFPGDPGGCFKNGCTAETYVDLCLDLARLVRKNHPGLKVEIGTWGEPFGGWGVPLWSGKPDRAEKSMGYFLGRLPEFGPETFTSINLGLSPDCDPKSHGGDGRPHARRAAGIVPVLTWDYSATEGEGTVSPRCRVRRIFERRREEAALGFYSGGIAYTMAPRLNFTSLFAAAEAYWDPARDPGAVLADFGRLVFGGDGEVGPLLEEFEVIPDWGHYPPFPYSPGRLEKAMGRLIPLLEKVGPGAESRLPLAVPLREHVRDLLFFADLFRNLATAAASLDEMAAIAKASGRVRADRADPVGLDEAEEFLAGPGDFPGKDRLRELAGRLRSIDVRALRKRYWTTVYGIYDEIQRPVDPRAEAATETLFRRFHAEAAAPRLPSRLERALLASGKPFLAVDLGSIAGERGWTLAGFAESGEHEGETWRASFDMPGTISREDFRDRGYRWLVMRLTEGPAGDRKTIAVNGKAIGEFVRTGPPRDVRKEWWVTRSYPIPEGLLRDGRIEIRFADPGIAISEVILATEPVIEER
jgi:hypothetical protein